MKLSEAIIMGDSLKEASWDNWLSDYRGQNKICGCALGGAMLASGTTFLQYVALRENGSRFEDQLHARWPWLTVSQRKEIGELYKAICQGRKTLEQLVDYVRSIEPPEEEEKAREQSIEPALVGKGI